MNSSSMHYTGELAEQSYSTLPPAYRTPYAERLAMTQAHRRQQRQAGQDPVVMPSVERQQSLTAAEKKTAAGTKYLVSQYMKADGSTAPRLQQSELDRVPVVPTRQPSLMRQPSRTVSQPEADVEEANIAQSKYIVSQYMDAPRQPAYSQPRRQQRQVVTQPALKTAVEQAAVAQPEGRRASSATRAPIASQYMAAPRQPAYTRQSSQSRRQQRQADQEPALRTAEEEGAIARHEARAAYRAPIRSQYMAARPIERSYESQPRRQEVRQRSSSRETPVVQRRVRDDSAELTPIARQRTGLAGREPSMYYYSPMQSSDYERQSATPVSHYQPSRINAQPSQDTATFTAKSAPSMTNIQFQPQARVYGREMSGYKNPHNVGHHASDNTVASGRTQVSNSRASPAYTSGYRRELSTVPENRPVQLSQYMQPGLVAQRLRPERVEYMTFDDMQATPVDERIVGRTAYKKPVGTANVYSVYQAPLLREEKAPAYRARVQQYDGEPGVPMSQYVTNDLREQYASDRLRPAYRAVRARAGAESSDAAVVPSAAVQTADMDVEQMTAIQFMRHYKGVDVPRTVSGETMLGFEQYRQQDSRKRSAAELK